MYRGLREKISYCTKSGIREDGREEIIKNIFSLGISDNEIVPGGALLEYSYKKELAGFMTTYIDFTNMEKDFALYACERSVRLLFHRSDEFVEEKHCSLERYLCLVIIRKLCWQRKCRQLL